MTAAEWTKAFWCGCGNGSPDVVLRDYLAAFLPRGEDERDEDMREFELDRRTQSIDLDASRVFVQKYGNDVLHLIGYLLNGTGLIRHSGSVISSAWLTPLGTEIKAEIEARAFGESAPDEHDEDPPMDTPAVREAAMAIRRVYEYGTVGGNLHVLVDDENVEDDTPDFCAAAIEENYHGIPPEGRAVERRCLELLRGLSEDERISAIRLHRGQWDSPAIDPLEHPRIDRTDNWPHGDGDDRRHFTRYVASASIPGKGRLSVVGLAGENASQENHELVKRKIVEELRRMATEGNAEGGPSS